MEKGREGERREMVNKRDLPERKMDLRPGPKFISQRADGLKVKGVKEEINTVRL